MVGTEETLPKSVSSKEKMDPENKKAKSAPETRETLEKLFDDLDESKDNQMKIVKTFLEREKFTRSDIARLKSVTQSFDTLTDVEDQLVSTHIRWIRIMEKDSQDVASSAKFKPDAFNAELDSLGELLDSVKTKFKEMSETFPEHETVKSILKDYVSKPNDAPENVLFDGKSHTVSGKGAEYAKTKLPKLKQEIESKLQEYQFEFELGVARNIKAEDLFDGVNILVKILDVDGKFEKLIRELEENEDNADEADIFEKWKSETVVKVNKLKNNLSKTIKPDSGPAVQKDSSTFQTFFKKLSPPTFTGDCLDYLEWKTKWKSVVSICKQPPSFELDRIKENIPEAAKKKLFDVNSLPVAWNILDKLYGDTKLITQKLKNKMKNLRPASKEPHEIIIELHEEVEYLIKRLLKLGVKDLLNTDSDYLNAIYSHLPEPHKLLWDDWDISDYDDEWQAFSVFLEEKYESELRNLEIKKNLKL